MISNFATVVDDSEIEGLLAYEAKSKGFIPSRSWIEWGKMSMAVSFDLSLFYMNGIPFITKFCKEGMFVQVANNFVPCGYFKYRTIETHNVH